MVNWMEALNHWAQSQPVQYTELSEQLLDRQIEDMRRGIRMKLKSKRLEALSSFYSLVDEMNWEQVLSYIDKMAIVNDKELQLADRYIPPEVKKAVWERDGGRCVKCGSQSEMHFDHIIPRSKGGSTTVENLQLLCKSHNLAKGSRIDR